MTKAELGDAPSAAALSVGRFPTWDQGPLQRGVPLLPQTNSVTLDKALSLLRPSFLFCYSADTRLEPGVRNSTPLQYSCLENPMDRGAWWAAVCGATKSQTRLSTRALERCSVALCNSMGSTPGFPVLHHLPEPAQTHVHWVSDAIQPPHPLSSPSPPAFNLSQHQGLF